MALEAREVEFCIGAFHILYLAIPTNISIPLPYNPYVYETYIPKLLAPLGGHGYALVSDVGAA